MTSAIIYDLDDTMVNSDPLHARAWEELLNEHGHEFGSLPESMRSSFIGMRVVDIVSEIVDHLEIQTSKDDIYQKRINIFLDIVKNELDPMPGLMESLERFKNAGFKLAVASSGAEEYINLVLDKFAIRDYFCAIVTGDDVKAGKPNPEAYLKAASKLGVDPAACVVLEDAAKGIEAAKAAGCKCIAVSNPNVPAQDFAKADLVVHSLDKVGLKTIEGLN